MLPVADSFLSYPGDPTNPVLSASPPNGLGVGPIDSVLDLLRFPISASYQLTDHLWVGAGPTLTVGLIVADPGLFSAPNSPVLNDPFSYPAATHSRFTWGAGFQVGANYTTDVGLNFGASLSFNVIAGLRPPLRELDQRPSRVPLRTLAVLLGPDFCRLRLSTVRRQRAVLKTPPSAQRGNRMCERMVRDSGGAPAGWSAVLRTGTGKASCC